MIKERFYEGDVVDLVPYTAIVDDYGLSPLLWSRFEENNPHVIREVNLNDDGTVCYYGLEDDPVHWCWPPHAFALHERQAEVEVGDLL